MIEIDASTPPELVPLAWLVGGWSGSGVLSYRLGDETIEREFGQRISFAIGAGPWLEYRAAAWLEGESPERPYFVESGFWRLARPLGSGDVSPGMLPPSGAPVFATADAVETLRVPIEGEPAARDGAAPAPTGFEVEAVLARPDGVAEVYLGLARPARIDLATDAVVRTASAREYSAATRLYGLVDDHLLWAWDVAALGQDLRTHASGRLARDD
ncbi:MAG: FABP family protein [Actinomycetales bacterium]|nr:FABP family protein [Actinomycetales bacterium]